MNRRGFLQGLTALAAGLRFWRSAKPIASLPTAAAGRDPAYVEAVNALTRTPDGTMYRLVRLNRRVRRGQLVYWENGQIAGAAAGDIAKRHYGYIQITNVPITYEVTFPNG